MRMQDSIPLGCTGLGGSFFSSMTTSVASLIADSASVKWLCHEEKKIPSAGFSAGLGAAFFSSFSCSFSISAKGSKSSLSAVH